MRKSNWIKNELEESKNNNGVVGDGVINTMMEDEFEDIESSNSSSYASRSNSKS